MGEGIEADWPSDDIVPVSEEEPHGEVEQSSAVDEVTASESDDMEPGELPEQTELATRESWTFPVRAAPILALQGEEVTEFPLSQHRSGHESTSIVMDDELMRVVEARYDADGVRRLNVRMALVKEHISGYSHTHLDLFRRLKPVWFASIGFGLLAATTVAQSLLVLGGGLFMFAGIAGLLMSKLDLHRISFSDHGGRHDFYLSGWGQEPFLIHNSTALLGPAFVDFLRTGTLETQHIDAVVDSMAQPPQPALEAKDQSSVFSQEIPLLPSPQEPVTTPITPPSSEEPMPLPPPSEATPSPGPPVSMPEPLPPTPPTPSVIPPPPLTLPPAPLPQPVALPPAPLPQPAALPPAPLPPLPLTPAPRAATIEEDALWDDLN